MSVTLNFNRTFKNGWIVYRLAGVPGGVYIDGRTATPEMKANPPATITVEGFELLPPGANATEMDAAKAAKKLEQEAKKAEKANAAAAKATARLEKLQAAAAKSQAAVDAIKARVGATTEQAADGAAL